MENNNSNPSPEGSLGNSSGPSSSQQPQDPEPQQPQPQLPGPDAVVPAAQETHTDRLAQFLSNERNRRGEGDILLSKTGIRLSKYPNIDDPNIKFLSKVARHV